MPRHRRAAGCLVLLTLTLSVLPGQAPSAATPSPSSTSTTWRAELRNPDGGFASLRAKSVDADGNTAEYTVIRAYRLR